MLVIDAEEQSSQYERPIRAAFAAHGIQLSASAMLTPRAQLSNRRLGRALRGASMLPSDARSDLRSMLDLPEDGTLEARSLQFGARRVSAVEGATRIDLTGLSERLEGVTVRATQTALVGNFERGTAMLGAVESSVVYAKEVRGFVATLVKRDAIAFDEGQVRKPRGSGYVLGKGAYTHVVRERRGEKVLERVTFACGCCAGISEE